MYCAILENLASPHYDLVLCLFSPASPFSTSLFRFWRGFSFFQRSFPVSPRPLSVSSLILSAPFLVSLSSLTRLRLSTPPLRFIPPLLPLLCLGRWRTSWPTTSMCQRRRSRRRRLMRLYSLAQRRATPPRS